jgi:hypothetical protein
MKKTQIHKFACEWGQVIRYRKEMFINTCMCGNVGVYVLWVMRSCVLCCVVLLSVLVRVLRRSA